MWPETNTARNAGSYPRDDGSKLAVPTSPPSTVDWVRLYPAEPTKTLPPSRPALRGWARPTPDPSETLASSGAAETTPDAEPMATTNITTYSQTPAASARRERAWVLIGQVERLPRTD